MLVFWLAAFLASSRSAHHHPGTNKYQISCIRNPFPTDPAPSYVLSTSSRAHLRWRIKATRAWQQSTHLEAMFGTADQSRRESATTLFCTPPLLCAVCRFLALSPCFSQFLPPPSSSLALHKAFLAKYPGSSSHKRRVVVCSRRSMTGALPRSLTSRGFV